MIFVDFFLAVLGAGLALFVLAIGVYLLFCVWLWLYANQNEQNEKDVRDFLDSWK